ncbi:MAG: hypothetical protein KBF93_04815 [Leptospiraceae bacterium]|nr:hypothetical protein [Leptospiraceae bacterium]
MNQQSIDNLEQYAIYRKELSDIYTDIADKYLGNALEQLLAREAVINDPVKFTNTMDFMIDHFVFDSFTEIGTYIYQDYFSTFLPNNPIRGNIKSSIESSFVSVFEFISYDEDNKELTIIDIFTDKKYTLLDKSFKIVTNIEGTFFLVFRLLQIPDTQYFMHSGGVKHPILGLDAKTIIKKYWKANKRLDLTNHPERKVDFFLDF